MLVRGACLSFPDTQVHEKVIKVEYFYLVLNVSLKKIKEQQFNGFVKIFLEISHQHH